MDTQEKLRNEIGSDVDVILENDGEILWEESANEEVLRRVGENKEIIKTIK